MERCFRDIQMLSTHNVFRIDQVAERWALAHFDLPRAQAEIRALLRAYGIVPPPRMGLWTKKGRAWLAEQSWPMPTGGMRRDVLLTQLAQCDEIVKTLTDQLDTIADKHPGVILLQTIPGVGPRTAEAVVAYMEDAQRFARTNRVASYFGLVPRPQATH